ncbi:MAG: peptidyl-tRNA hydrolase Pth2 [Candidatus Thermoplasmatota archaeon]|nr:peptidyl-tRNA hydrolase Pth2 [Candidatus Thermoplasmatota archaeon]MDI6856307.1 peptidyl-tRNA hydrolase Pth2 [Candidatus Thermoplasmatota archaeon]
MNNYKLAVVVRNDLKLSKGKLAVQVAHACVTCTVNAKAHKKEWLKKWYAEGQKKVVLKTGSLEELYILKSKAEEKALPTHLVTDAGLTELKPGTITCLGIGPAPNEIIDTVTGKLKLL